MATLMALLSMRVQEQDCFSQEPIPHHEVIPLGNEEMHSSCWSSLVHAQWPQVKHVLIIFETALLCQPQG
jgi:hypothetical protein